MSILFIFINVHINDARLPGVTYLHVIKQKKGFVTKFHLLKTFITGCSSNEILAFVETR